jgi:hypothetical protein
MTTGNTTLLGLALPVEGELDGTWGDVVNDSITSLVDSAVAGTTTLSADADVTLTTTVLAANQARQAVILWTASNGATARNITAPAQSKPYIVINAGTGSIVLRGAGPTTGITIAASEKCLAAWNGSDFVKVATSATATGTVTSVGGTGTVNGITLTGTVTSTGNLTLGGTLSGVSLSTQVTGTLPVANGGTGATTLTANNVLLGNGTSALQVVAPGTIGNVLTSDGTTWTSAAAASGSIVQYPQNSRSADYTLVLGDAGKQIFHPSSDTESRVFTIPANSSVAFPVGTVVLITVENGARSVSVAITSDTLVFGSGTTGAVSVPSNNTLMCIKVTATKWMANYLYQTGIPTSLQAIAVAHQTTPHVSAYPWSGSGFGTKYFDPATLPPSTGNSVAFSPAGDAIAVAHNVTPFISTYTWSGSGFGTKFADPATLPTGIGAGVAFSLAGDAIAVSYQVTPFISAYPWSRSGFGTKFADPATLPTGSGNEVAFSPAGDAIAVAHGTTPFISAYPWSGSGFGTKYSDPATLPTGTGQSVAFSPAGDAIAVAHFTTPFISAYPWSGSGFGTKFADPATLPASSGQSVAFSPAGDAIAVTHNSTPFVTAYPWSGSGFGTKFANPSTLPASTGNGVAFSPAGDAIAVAHATTPFISTYLWSGSGFGTKYANPATLPTGTGNGVAFTING